MSEVESNEQESFMKVEWPDLDEFHSSPVYDQTRVDKIRSTKENSRVGG